MTKLYDSLIGIPWYHPKQYTAARLRMADALTLPKSYEVWRERAEKREEKAGQGGAVTMRVYVDGDKFVCFCRAKGLILDSKARSNYAGAYAASMTKPKMAGCGIPWARFGLNRG